MNKLIVLALIAICFFAILPTVTLVNSGPEVIRRLALPIGGGDEPTGGGDAVNAGAAHPGIPK